jgi:hypothetical protein
MHINFVVFGLTPIGTRTHDLPIELIERKPYNILKSRVTLTSIKVSNTTRILTNPPKRIMFVCLLKIKTVDDLQIKLITSNI